MQKVTLQKLGFRLHYYTKADIKLLAKLTGTEVKLMKKKSVTMSDIAKAMDISTVTVSKALGDKDGVSEELREKIKQKANEMGYRFSYTSK